MQQYSRGTGSRSFAARPIRSTTDLFTRPSSSTSAKKGAAGATVSRGIAGLRESEPYPDGRHPSALAGPAGRDHLGSTLPSEWSGCCPVSSDSPPAA